jgi:hypothetical protein
VPLPVAVPVCAGCDAYVVAPAPGCAVTEFVFKLPAVFVPTTAGIPCLYIAYVIAYSFKNVNSIYGIANKKAPFGALM